MSDGQAPRAAAYETVPGFASALIWSTPADAVVGRGSGRSKQDAEQRAARAAIEALEAAA